MIPSGIFLLLFAAAVSGLQDRRWLSMALFFACWIAIALLFWHHASDTLNINL